MPKGCDSLKLSFVRLSVFMKVLTLDRIRWEAGGILYYIISELLVHVTVTSAYIRLMYIAVYYSLPFSGVSLNLCCRRNNLQEFEIYINLIDYDYQLFKGGLKQYGFCNFSSELLIKLIPLAVIYVIIYDFWSLGRIKSK